MSDVIDLLAERRRRRDARFEAHAAARLTARQAAVNARGATMPHVPPHIAAAEAKLLDICRPFLDHPRLLVHMLDALEALAQQLVHGDSRLARQVLLNALEEFDALVLARLGGRRH